MSFHQILKDIRNTMVCIFSLFFCLLLFFSIMFPRFIKQTFHFLTTIIENS